MDKKLSKKMLTALALVVFFFYHSLTFATGELKYPRIGVFLRNLSSTSYDIIDVKCKPISALEINCSFVQAILRHKTSPHNIEEEFTEEWNESDSKEKEKALKELLEGLMNNKNCSLLKEKNNEIIETLRKNPKGLSEAELTSKLQDYIQPLLYFCNNRTMEGLKFYLKSQKQIEAKTCKLSTYSWTEKFKFQVHSNKWISQNEPDGCSINISTLFQTKNQKEFYEWTYETRKVITNKEDPICKLLDESPATYVFSHGNKYMNCVYIDYGI